MENQIKFATGLHMFGDCSDRFVADGYKEEKTVKEMIEDAQQIDELSGVEIITNTHIDTNTVDNMKKMLEDAGLQVSLVLPDLFVSKKWSKGSLTANDKNIREAALQEIKASMDIAAELNCPFINVWCGHDGFDYSFQADYELAWELIIEGIRKCCDYRDDVNVGVEYKIKEPRTHLFLSTVGKCLLLLNEIQRENTGVILDVGHALYGYENPAESAVLLDKFGKKLSYLHLNDNYRFWDDDMMPGSVHIPEYLELFYWLQRINYKGWYSLDVFPYRIDGIDSARESIQFIKMLINNLEKVDEEQIKEVITKRNAVESMKIVRKILSD